MPVFKASQAVGPRHSAPLSFLSHRRFVSVSKFALFSVLFGVLGSNVLDVEAVEGDGGVTTFFSSDEGRQCACSYDENTDYFPDKLTPNYAQTFDVKYFNHYKVITVDMGTSTETYYAYLCGTPMPNVPEGATAIEIPLRNVGVMSTTMLPAFEYIRQRDIVDFVNVNADSVASSCMQEYIASDAVLTTDSGNLTYAIAEKTLDALFVGPWSAFTGKNAIQANCATTKTIMYNAGVEKSVLGTAEWVEFVALFFNREEASGDIVDNIAARYECAVEKAATAVAELSTEEVKYNQTVLWVSYWSELYGWYISACGDSGTDSTRSTWYCEMLNHVGAVSLDYSEFTPGGSLTWEQLHTLDLASVDVVIWAVDDLHAERAKNTKLDELFTYNLTNAQVFDVSKHGVNQWFQSRPAEPDVLLQDLVSVFLPSAAINEHERYYLRNVSSTLDLELDPSADECADPTAATFTNYRQSACNATSTLIPGLDRPVPSCEDKSEQVFNFVCTNSPTKAPTSVPTAAPTKGAASIASLNAALLVAASVVASALAAF